MDLYALAQQRNMLACMGIDLWVTKDVSNLQTVENSLYRDRVVEQHQALPAVVLVDQVVAEPEVKVVEQIAVKKQEKQESQHKVVHQADTVEAVVEPELDQVISIAPFEIQAVVLPKCILIVDGTQLSAEQQQLWVNIQAAQVGQSYSLKWPFALAQFQDGRGVTSYVHGFLAMLQQEHTLISLGQLPITLTTKIIDLPDLQDMLDQPLLKRQLWQHMQGQASSI